MKSALLAIARKHLPLYLATAVWTAGTLALLLAPVRISPPSIAVSIPQLDKLVHVALFAGFAYLWRRSLSKTGRFLHPALDAFVLAAAVGGATEIAQAFIPYRDCDLFDFIADVAGAIAALFVPI